MRPEFLRSGTTLEDCNRAETIARSLGAFVETLARTLIISNLPATAFDAVDGVAHAACVPPGMLENAVDTAKLAASAPFRCIVVDRRVDQPGFRGGRLKRWHAGRQRTAQLRSLLAPGGQVLLLVNARCARESRRLLAVERFTEIEQYFLFPETGAAQHLISDRHQAVRTFMCRVHGLSYGLPGNPSLWPRWLAVCLGADLLQLSWRLIRARRD